MTPIKPTEDQYEAAKGLAICYPCAKSCSAHSTCPDGVSHFACDCGSEAGYNQMTDAIAQWLAEREAKVIEGWQIGRIKRLSMELAHLNQEKKACGDNYDRGTWLAGAIHAMTRARNLLHKRA